MGEIEISGQLSCQLFDCTVVLCMSDVGLSVCTVYSVDVVASTIHGSVSCLLVHSEHITH